MLIKKSNPLIVMIAIMISGCTWIDTIKNLSQGWVRVEDKSLLINGKGLHIRINDRFIWETGNEALEVSTQIAKSLVILIDDIPLDDNSFLFISTLQFPQDIYTTDGQRVGSHYDSTHVYVRELNLVEGEHIVSVIVTSISGATYSYSWEFTVKYG